LKKEDCCTLEINGEIIQENCNPHFQGIHDFDGVYHSIANDAIEPVTAQEGLHVMQIIEAGDPK
jgi:predicted dehydrogenase